jgi:hypothetical protein
MVSTMEDPNLIACLFPAQSRDKGPKGKNTWEVIYMPENVSRYILPHIPLQIPLQGQTKSDCRSRESTVPLEEKMDNTPNGTYPGLELTFNHGPKASKGFVIGTDPNSCDIVLPKLPHISRFHCAVTFDTQRRLILRDLSSNGTIVTYDDKGGESR